MKFGNVGFMHKILIIAIILFQSSTLYTQENILRLHSDSLPENLNIINYGFEKVVNTYFFRINGTYKSSFDLGGIDLFQSYLGTALKTNVTSFRDDENFIFEYSYPLLKNLDLMSINDWFLSADARDIGLNKLQKIRSRIGAKYLLYEESFITLSYGFEQNEQIGKQTYGQVLNSKAEIRNYDLEGINLNTILYSDLLHLNDGRNFNNINCDVLFDRVYDNNKFNFHINYKNLNQDFLGKISNNGKDYSIENRTESRIITYFNTDYQIFDWLVSKLDINLNNGIIKRSFDDFYEGNLISGVERSLSEMDLDVNFFMKYETKNFHEILEFSYGFINEENNIKNIKNINNTDFNNLQNQENSKDNSTNLTKIRLETFFRFDRSNQVNINLFSSIFRYDTPSNINNDDRDELSIFGNMDYTHIFSKSFRMNVEMELQLNHLVFLKSQRSSLNNWNRVIRFSPGFKYELEKFKYYPRIEVLANYTVYDFEEETAGIQSFSFRQISYNDSLSINSWENRSILNIVKFRWFERGILFWNNFSEVPQNRNIEFFDKLMIFLSKGNKANVGVGLRYYGIFQKNISNNVLTNSDIYQISVGPQTDISIEFDKWLFVRLSGWYEFQKTNTNPNYKGIANVFFESKILL